ncbi:MAG: hypothetical protein IPK79_08120 [Vampirovibrionales bacterium]|nr:hypothetical protein [Vampirovibrionales bacterium]
MFHFFRLACDRSPDRAQWTARAGRGEADARQADRKGLILKGVFEDGAIGVAVSIAGAPIATIRSKVTI